MINRNLGLTNLKKPDAVATSSNWILQFVAFTMEYSTSLALALKCLDTPDLSPKVFYYFPRLALLNCLALHNDPLDIQVS